MVPFDHATKRPCDWPLSSVSLPTLRQGGELEANRSMSKDSPFVTDPHTWSDPTEASMCRISWAIVTLCKQPFCRAPHLRGIVSLDLIRNNLVHCDV
jgi:hypothetical protein